MARVSKIRNGYSLIEVLVVLAIVGILATAGIYYRQSSVPAAVKSTTASLNGAFRSAQTLAVSSGQQVYLRTTGGGTVTPKLEWGFRILKADGSLNNLGAVQGTWTLLTGEARFVSLGVGSTDLTNSQANPLPKDVAAISNHVLDNTTIWTRNFFTGSSTATADALCPYFMGSGAINQELAVTVTGVRSGGGVFVGGNRMGLIIVSPVSGISTFSKQNPEISSSPWTRS